jgi:hypothetical protein
MPRGGRSCKSPSVPTQVQSWPCTLALTQQCGSGPGLLGLVCIAVEPGSDPRLARTDAKVAVPTGGWAGRCQTATAPGLVPSWPAVSCTATGRQRHVRSPSGPCGASLTRATRSRCWTRSWLGSMRPGRRRGPWRLMPTCWPTRPRLTAFACCRPRTLPAAARPDHAPARPDAAPTGVAAGPATRGGVGRGPAGRDLAVTAGGQAPGRDRGAVDAVGNTDPGRDSGRGGPDRTASRLPGGAAHHRHLTIGG